MDIKQFNVVSADEMIRSAESFQIVNLDGSAFESLPLGFLHIHAAMVKAEGSDDVCLFPDFLHEVVGQNKSVNINGQTSEMRVLDFMLEDSSYDREDVKAKCFNYMDGHPVHGQYTISTLLLLTDSERDKLHALIGKPAVRWAVDPKELVKQMIDSEDEIWIYAPNKHEHYMSYLEAEANDPHLFAINAKGQVCFWRDYFFAAFKAGKVLAYHQEDKTFKACSYENAYSLLAIGSYKVLLEENFENLEALNDEHRRYISACAAEYFLHHAPVNILAFEPNIKHTDWVLLGNMGIAHRDDLQETAQKLANEGVVDHELTRNGFFKRFITL
jgi:hypothetical protein